MSSSDPDTYSRDVLHGADAGISDNDSAVEGAGMETMKIQISLMPMLLARKRNIKLMNNERVQGPEEESNDYLGARYETTGCGPYKRGDDVETLVSPMNWTDLSAEVCRVFINK